MATSYDFPISCATNVYTLGDFGEIAYIVCTVAIPPPTPDTPPQVLSPEETLARLRKTERQFREASILAALDPQARQLFTFYKKVDIANAKDQKALLSKFGYVLRSNACTIAYKTAARLPDLLKPEQARLYRLFTAAITSSIRLVPANDRAIQTVGLNLYLIEDLPAATSIDRFDSTKKWSLFRLDLQIILSGHIVLTIVREDTSSFFRASDIDSNDVEVTDSRCSGYLAPLGIIARFKLQRAAKFGTELSFQMQTDYEPSLSLVENVWKELLPQWLKEHGEYLETDKSTRWVETEIVVKTGDVVQTDSQKASSPNTPSIETTTWKTIFWPSELCFVSESPPLPPEAEGTPEDALQFVQKWISGTALSPARDAHQGQNNDHEDDDEPLFNDDGPFDEPFHPYGPPSFPQSQTIYPTPPDAVMTHPTPGFSSVDGLATTPANLLRGPADMVSTQDEQMPDYDEPTNLSGGFYDEDLFDEMPGDTFGQEAAGDEPNWDFFDDEPGNEPKDQEPGMSSNGQSNVDILSAAKVEHATNAVRQTPVETLPASVHAKDEISKKTNSEQISPSMPRDSRPTNSTVAKQNELPLATESLPSRDVRDQYGTKSTNRPRRPSAFDGVQPSLDLSERDSKYSANGDFWFDPKPKRAETGELSRYQNILHMIPSSPSDTDETDDSSRMSFEQHVPLSTTSKVAPQWTEYRAQTPPAASEVTEPEEQKIRQETQQMLALLHDGSMKPPSIPCSGSGAETRELPDLSAAEVTDVAQILVDQVSQSSLLSVVDSQHHSRPASDEEATAGLNLSGINSNGTPSTLSQLVNLQADGPSINLSGRMARLPNPQIRVRRGNHTLTASMSIIEFWDTLNLKPDNGGKDVTVFCVCPDAQNILDGCSNLLRRMSDAYTSCLLGEHKVGRVPNFTENGLVPWSIEDFDDSSRRCAQLGDHLGLSTDLEGLVVVYIISPTENMNDYLDTCHAFYALFGAFRDSVTDKTKVADIALQIIPQGFVASSEMLVIPPQSAYLKLAREVYNRLPPVKSETTTTPAGSCSSAVTMVKMDSSVHFHLSSSYSSPFSKSGPCLHLAYSISHDERWISAAWTDETGTIALSMSYCIQLWSSGPRRQRQEIFREMWGTSQDIMAKVPGTWRLNVVKNGHFDVAEVKEWCKLEDERTPATSRCKLILLSARLRPMLRIVTPKGSGKSGTATLGNMYGTPGSTPQAGITSPDQLMAATPTPGGSGGFSAATPPEHGFDPNAESDITLIDPSEESWSIILPYGVNQSSETGEIRPALVTGFLMKRRGEKGEDGLSAIEVSWVHGLPNAADMDKMPVEELLDDVLRQYRGLVSLGATRGCIDPSIDCLPWHIVTAVRGADVLGEVL
ncbi:hypothetical protein PV10_03075 [Exophiala mesophila]|uniref:Mediator of RNA polymerase II transcription subunit 13 n=1 Tax=Exophiala mesophila TaxID=212818 RepID=A0A0D1X0V8_EXOME|nr:uncharacterized protein PV10_03075 [Exophiala mesophila]KIV95415.1 hypothetical protein PV10_03075 [Exophiala mesophila]